MYQEAADDDDVEDEDDMMMRMMIMMMKMKKKMKLKMVNEDYDKNYVDADVVDDNADDVSSDRVKSQD